MIAKIGQHCYADAPKYEFAADLPAWLDNTIREIPGVACFQRRIRVPVNAAALVVERINAAGVAVQAQRAPADEALRGWDHAIGEKTPTDEQIAEMLDQTAIRPWVWRRDQAGRRFLLDYQARCLRFALARGCAHVWAPPGSGKTLIALAWAAGLDGASPAMRAQRGPALVVTRRVAAEQWRREVDRYCDGAAGLVIRPASQRRKGDPDPAEWAKDQRERGKLPIVIVAWSELWDRQDELLSLNPYSVVFDEAHFAKAHKRAKWAINEQGKPEQVGEVESRSTAAAKLARAIPRRLATTASPIADAIPDLWGQLTLVEPWAWGQTATAFLRRHAGAELTPGGWMNLSAAKARPDEPAESYRARLHLDELGRRLAFSAISIPYAVSHAELPPKRREIRRVPVDEQDAEIGGDARELADAMRRNDADRAAEIRLGRAASRKRSAIVEAVRDYSTVGKGKVLIFDGRKRNVEAIAKSLGKIKGLATLTATGDDSNDAVAATVDAYMNHPGPVALVATWHKIGSSLNLHDTDALIWSMLPYTPEAVEQGEGRVDRLGMTRPVVYLYLVASGTVDDHVADILLNKLPAVAELTPGRRLDAYGGLREALSREGETDAILAELARKIAQEAEADDLD